MTKVNTDTVFGRKDILSILEFKATQYSLPAETRLTVGLVGYPNVGKSSVINVLCGKKRVGVAAMPGKTKHF